MKTDKEILEKVVRKFDNQSQMTISNKIEMEFCLKECIKLTKFETKKRVLYLIDSMIDEREKELKQKDLRGVEKFHNWQNTHWLYERIHQLKEIRKQI